MTQTHPVYIMGHKSEYTSTAVFIFQLSNTKAIIFLKSNYVISMQTIKKTIFFNFLDFHLSDLLFYSLAGSHQRQKGSDYSSTSEEERDVSSKTKCAHTSTSTQTQTPQRLIPTRLDIEDDEAQNEHYQNWTNHSAEIARSDE